MPSLRDSVVADTSRSSSRSAGQPRRLSLHRRCGVHSARYTTFPPTSVATTFPVNCQLSNGELCDIDLDFAASKVHRFLGSNIVTSAKLPRASEPRPRRSKTRAGPEVKSSTMRMRSEEHTSELQSQSNLVCRLLLEKKQRACQE